MAGEDLGSTGKKKRKSMGWPFGLATLEVVRRGARVYLVYLCLVWLNSPAFNCSTMVSSIRFEKNENAHIF